MRLHYLPFSPPYSCNKQHNACYLIDLVDLQVVTSYTNQVHSSSENAIQQSRKDVLLSTAPKDAATKAMNPHLNCRAVK